MAKGLDDKVFGWPYEREELSAALLKLSDLIVDASDPDELGYAASEILGQALGVSRVGYSAIDPDAETLHTSKDWCAPGVMSLAGVLQLRDYGSFVDSLKRGEFISIADVRQDERTAVAAAALEGASARSFVNVPLIERGRLTAVMYVNYAEQRVWSKDELSFIQEVARRTRTAIGRLTAEAAIRESEEQLRAFTLASSGALYEMSADWSVMYQLQGDDFLADTKGVYPEWLSKYIHPVDKLYVQTAIDAAIKSKSVFELEHRVLREDGSIGWTRSRAIPIFDEKGDIRKWFGAASDITEKKRMEVAFRQKEKLTAVGQIASTIAHEINNPLESVTNLLYLARTSTEEPLVVEYLSNADVELRRIAAITSQTLQFHKQQSKPTEATAERLLSAALNTYQGRIQNSGVRVELRNRATGTFRCLEGEIHQVLNNLLGNAIDVMKQHGGRLILRSADAVDWKSGRPCVRITVADSGTGIPREILEDIFQPFFTTKGFAGTGLGLWISREIVDRHRGRLCVRSSTREDRAGTVFTVLLPRRIEPQGA